MTKSKIQEQHNLDLSGLPKDYAKAIEILFRRNAELEARGVALQNQIDELKHNLWVANNEIERLKPPKIQGPPSRWKRDGFF